MLVSIIVLVLCTSVLGAKNALLSKTAVYTPKKRTVKVISRLSLNSIKKHAERNCGENSVFLLLIWEANNIYHIKGPTTFNT